MDKIYTKKFQIQTYEVDHRAKALTLSLLNYLQDTAGNHAALLGFSVLDLLKKRMTWILSRYHVRIFRYPGLDERIVVSTWPSGKQGIFALRDFEIADERGEMLAAATSSWILWHVNAKQPARLEENLPDSVTHDKRALPDDFPTLPPCPTADRELAFRVAMQDIDFNNHVNHAVYIQWALETVPEELLRTFRPTDIEVAFKGEAFYGEEIVSRVKRIGDDPGPVFLHGIFNGPKEAELTRLRTVWGRV
jgi:medium-chain acyl-[acyl-carrier-protein] hydrolase